LLIRLGISSIIPAALSSAANRLKKMDFIAILQNPPRIALNLSVDRTPNRRLDAEVSAQIGQGTAFRKLNRQATARGFGKPFPQHAV